MSAHLENFVRVLNYYLLNGTVVINNRTIINNRRGAKGRPNIMGMSFGQFRQKLKLCTPQWSSKGVRDKCSVKLGGDD